MNEYDLIIYFLFFVNGFFLGDKVRSYLDNRKHEKDKHD